MTTLLDLQVANKCDRETVTLVYYHYVVEIMLSYWESTAIFTSGVTQVLTDYDFFCDNEVFFFQLHTYKCSAELCAIHRPAQQ
jgi:hypothetical protein